MKNFPSLPADKKENPALVMPPLLIAALLLLILTLVTNILFSGKNLLFPLIVALTIWFCILALEDFFSSFKVGRWKLPQPLATLAAFFTITLCIWSVIRIIQMQIVEVLTAAPMYQEKLQHIFDKILTLLKIKDPPKMAHIFEGVDFSSLVSGIGQTVTEIASNTGTITLYLIFLLLEHRAFHQKLHKIFGKKEHAEKLERILSNIYQQIKTYLKIKTLLSLLTASLSYTLLHYFMVDFALFWSFLIFILNFIPTIGSIIATALPLTIFLLQFGDIRLFIALSILLISVQIFIGNIIEPRLMGRSFNLSGLVLILSLFFWGQIWGIAGMFLSVPIAVIAKIIFANFQATRSIAILLSESGEI